MFDSYLLIVFFVFFVLDVGIHDICRAYVAIGGLMWPTVGLRLPLEGLHCLL